MADTRTLSDDSHALLVAIATANHHPTPEAWADEAKAVYEAPADAPEQEDAQ
jgi:hypothetical protein